MRTKTNCKAGGVYQNHNETMVRDNGKSLKIKTALRAGMTPSIPIPPPLGRR